MAIYQLPTGTYVTRAAFAVRGGSFRDKRHFGTPLCQEAGCRAFAATVFLDGVGAGSVVGAGPGSG